LKINQDLQTYLCVDWPSLRDDVLGDAVVYAFEPGLPGIGAAEQGILLLHARRPEVLLRLLDNLNQAQKASGELKSLDALEHQGTPYVRRVDMKGPHYYVMKGNLFAYTAQEGLLKGVLEQGKSGS